MYLVVVVSARVNVTRIRGFVAADVVVHAEDPPLNPTEEAERAEEEEILEPVLPVDPFELEERPQATLHAL